MTQDERYLLALYERIQNGAESVDRYLLGESQGLQPKRVNTLVQGLTQANFIKKIGDREIVITPQGIRLAEQLLEEL